MPTVKDPRKQAERLALKDKRARDASLAMKEYEAEKRAERAKTERLRALRLAKEAEDAAASEKARRAAERKTKRAAPKKAKKPATQDR